MKKKDKKDNCCNFRENIKKLLYYLKKDEIDYLEENHECVHYNKNAYIYRENDYPVGLICLAQGKVKIVKSGVAGREQIIRLAKPVGFIGYRALLADEVYRASAITLEPSQVIIIYKEPFFKVLKTNSDLSLQIIKYLASELGFSNSRCVTLTQKHIRGRLAESLLILAETYGFEDDGNTINVSLTREDLANLSNMTNSNAVRTLKQFEDENIIKINGRKISILDFSKLEKISKLG